MPRLTEQEQQEIIRFIEANKPLPDKYRFLLFEDKREVELVWNGKTNEVCNIVLPFQVIEQVDEPRAEKQEETALQMDMFSLDSRGRQLKGWTNKLIWGDNKLILSSLKNGPLREEIEKQGGLKLIYIDPPFDVGADFSMDIEIGNDTFTKKPNILEEIAYRDTWGKGADSFIAMIYERLVLMHCLLAENGVIFVHCDWRVNSFLRHLLDEIFGKDKHLNEIIWCYETAWKSKTAWSRKHDTIYFYSNSDNYCFDPSQSQMPRKRNKHMRIGIDENNREYEEKTDKATGKIYRWYFDEGKLPMDFWTDISFIKIPARTSQTGKFACTFPGNKSHLINIKFFTNISSPHEHHIFITEQRKTSRTGKITHGIFIRPGQLIRKLPVGHAKSTIDIEHTIIFTGRLFAYKEKTNGRITENLFFEPG